MFLTIHNLPHNIRYPEIKQLILLKCGLAEVVLDNLTTEGNNRKVTVGLADENDAAILVRKINGLLVGEQQLYVEKPLTRQGQAEQPYRPSSVFRANEAYPEEMELTGYGNSSNGNQNVPDANQRMYDSIQSMYTPNGQIMWDQAAMMMNIENTPSMGGMGAGGMMHRPAPNSFMGFGSQVQSQVPMVPQLSGVLANMGQTNQEDDRQRGGANRENTYQSNNPIFDTPSKRRQHYRNHFDNYSKWDEPVTRMGPDTQIRPVIPTSLDRWARDSYNAENNLQKKHDSSYGQRRETLGSEPFDVPMDVRLSDRYDRESAGLNFRPVSHCQSDSFNPWEKLDSFSTRSLNAENQEYFGSKVLNESFNEPWHQLSDIQRPSRQNLRFDEFKSLPTPQSHFDDPKPFGSRYYQERTESIAPRSNQDYYDRKTKWDRPNVALGRPKKRQLPCEPVPGPRDGSNEEKYIPKFYQDRRTYEEPRDPGTPSKQRLFGSTRFDSMEIDNKKLIVSNPATQQQQRPNTQGKLNVPPKPRTTITNLLQRDITWRGQAASEIAKDMVARLASNKNLPKHDPLLVALRRGIRTRLDILVGNKKSIPMKEIIDTYRKKFDTSTDDQFYNAIVDSVMKEKQAAESKGTPQFSGISPVEAQSVTQLPIKQIQSEMHTSKKDENVAAKYSDPQPSVPKAINPVKPKDRNKAKPAQQLQHKNKLPQYPFASKEIYKKQKMIQKMEMLSDCYDLDEITQKALNDIADTLCDIFMGECEGATTQNEIRICERISDHASDEFRKVIRLLLTKRLLNIKTNLQVRIYFNEKPPNNIIEQFTPFLRRFGALSLKKSAKKSKLFVVTCDSYENYDALCAMGQAQVCGYTLTFKPLHVTGPGARISRSQVLAQRQQFIENQIGTCAFLDKVEYPGHSKDNFAQKKDDSDYFEHDDEEGDANNFEEWLLEDNSHDAFYIDQSAVADDETAQDALHPDQVKDADDETAQDALYPDQDKDADDETAQDALHPDQDKDADDETAQDALYPDQGKDADDETAQDALYPDQGKDADDETAQGALHPDQGKDADDETAHFYRDQAEGADAPKLDDEEVIPDFDNLSDDDLEEW